MYPELPGSVVFGVNDHQHGRFKIELPRQIFRLSVRRTRTEGHRAVRGVVLDVHRELDGQVAILGGAGAGISALLSDTAAEKARQQILAVLGEPDLCKVSEENSNED